MYGKRGTPRQVKEGGNVIGCACGNASGPIGPSVVQLFRVRTLFPITVVCFLSLKVFFLFNSSNTIRVYLDPYI